MVLDKMIGSLVSLRLQKDGGAKSKQIRTNQSSHVSRSETRSLCITVHFTKLLKNGFRSSSGIPEVHYKLGNFIT